MDGTRRSVTCRPSTSRGNSSPSNILREANKRSTNRVKSTNVRRSTPLKALKAQEDARHSTMNAMGVLLYRLSWHFLLSAGVFRGTGIHDLHRLRSYLRQRFNIEEPRWVAPYQRPKKMLAGLRSNPVYPSDTFPWVVELEAAYPSILEEYKRLTEDDLRPHPEDLADTGRWNVFYLYFGARLVRRNANRCPKTLSALAKIPGAGAAGEVYFSIMVPGTHLRPHCGQTNARIRCHLCLTEARDCWIRVAEHKLQWVAGRCIIFDDSFEHEVWHGGDTPRAVLLFDFWHPDLTDAEQWALTMVRDDSRRLRARYRQFVNTVQKLPMAQTMKRANGTATKTWRT